MERTEQHEHWDNRYRTGNIPWDTGEPSSMLVQVVRDENIAPCRAVELGCGTGTNSVWLAQQGFEVVGVDVSELAIEHAGSGLRRRAFQSRSWRLTCWRRPTSGRRSAFSSTVVAIT